MVSCSIVDADIDKTGFSYTLSVIDGKYKMVILYCLMEFETVRFNEMKGYIKGISYKTLSANLKELEEDGLVNRVEYPQIPPKVEYSLTDVGKTLIPILDAMCNWGEEHRPESARCPSSHSGTWSATAAARTPIAWISRTGGEPSQRRSAWTCPSTMPSCTPTTGARC